MIICLALEHVITLVDGVEEEVGVSHAEQGRQRDS